MITSNIISNPKFIDTFGLIPKNNDAKSQLLRAQWVWRFWFVGVVLSTFLTGLLMIFRGPSLSLLGWMLFSIGVFVVLYQPRYGIYLIVFLTLVGDFRLTYWFPFVKNFSSQESLLYIHDAIIISPLELFLILTTLSWLGRKAIQRKFDFYFSSLFWIALIFGTLIGLGLVSGVLRGGSVNIALWESRSIFYLPYMVFLTGNLLESRTHLSNLMWFLMGALFIEAIIGFHFYFVILNRDLSTIDRIAAHAASIHINTYFIYLFSVWIFQASWVKRLLLPLMIPFFFITYIAMQRRAGFITLAIGLILIAIVLFKDNRKLFFIIIPPIAAIGLVYLVVFWNSNGALGVPAQAFKSVVASDQSSAEDRASDLYRLVENFNARFNMHHSPLFGSGFGRKILFVIPLPDISTFVFWEYILHNSIIWIWIKTGVLGFFSLLFLIGVSLIDGIRAVIKVQDPDVRAIVFSATAYILMHFVYAYVDMSWDVESMIYIGVAIGIVACAEHIVEKPIPSVSNKRNMVNIPLSFDRK